MKQYGINLFSTCMITLEKGDFINSMFFNDEEIRNEFALNLRIVGYIVEII